MHTAWVFLLDFSFKKAGFWVECVAMMLVLLYVAKKCCIRILPYQCITDFPASYREMSIEALVTHVPDGDGFEFSHIPFLCFGENTDACRLKARLAGIDAPENSHVPALRQPLSAESQCYLSLLVLNKVVTLKLLSMDRHYRFLAIAYVDGINVNLEMLRAGYASLYRAANAEYDDDYHIFNNAELFAKKRQNGIWGLDKLVLPSEYKRRSTRP